MRQLNLVKKDKPATTNKSFTISKKDAEILKGGIGFGDDIKAATLFQKITGEDINDFVCNNGCWWLD